MHTHTHKPYRRKILCANASYVRNYDGRTLRAHNQICLQQTTKLIIWHIALQSLLLRLYSKQIEFKISTENKKNAKRKMKTKKEREKERQINGWMDRLKKLFY